MPYKTQYGKHYHTKMGCHGATIPCDTKGLTPCSDCCDAGGESIGGHVSGGGKGYVISDVSPNGDGTYTVTGKLADGSPMTLTMTPDGPNIADLVDDLQSRRFEQELRDERQDDMLRASEAVEAASIAYEPAPEAGTDAVSARIAALRKELAELEALQASQTVADEVDESDPNGAFAPAERALDERLRRDLAYENQGGIEPMTYEEMVSESVQRFGQDYWRRNGRPRLDSMGPRERRNYVIGLADAMETAGYGDKATPFVLSDLSRHGHKLSVECFREIEQRRNDRVAEAEWRKTPAGRIDSLQSEVMEEMGLDSVPTNRREEMIARIAERIDEEGLAGSIDSAVLGELTDNNAHTAVLAAERVLKAKEEAARPKRQPRRARGGSRRSDPMKGMTPQEEQDAFDREFSTTTTDAYMGAKGFEGSKSGRGLYGKELSGAVRSDLKEWLGHLGVPKSGVKVRMHRFSGGSSMDIEAKLDRDRYGASEAEFKDAYRRNFWSIAPKWGYVKTSQGEVDVSRLMDHNVDQGALMQDIIDTAWRDYESGATSIDTGRSGPSGNPRHLVYLNEEGRKVAERMQRIVDAYNYDDSNGMVDYFSTGFYAWPKVVLS